MSILESFTFACVFKFACRGGTFVPAPKDFFLFHENKERNFPFFILII